MYFDILPIRILVCTLIPPVRVLSLEMALEQRLHTSPEMVTDILPRDFKMEIVQSMPPGIFDGAELTSKDTMAHRGFHSHPAEVEAALTLHYPILFHPRH